MSTNAAVQHGYTKQPKFGGEGSKVGVYCMEDAEGDMVCVRHKRFAQQGCSKRGVYYGKHAEAGMVYVGQKGCAPQGCSIRSRFGLTGSNIWMYCKERAEDGMVDVRHEHCAKQCCSIRRSFRVVGSRSMCTGRTMERMA